MISIKDSLKRSGGYVRHEYPVNKKFYRYAFRPFDAYPQNSVS